MKRPLRTVSVGAMLAALFAVAPASAHHSFAMFDRDRTVSLVGTVKKWDWINPHSWLYLTVTPAGKPAEEWSLEAASLSELSRRGWARDSMKSGDRVTVTINPRKDGKTGGSLVRVVMADGKSYGGRGGPPAEGGPAPAPAAAPPAQ